MGILQDRTAAQQWYQLVSQVYDPFVGETFWPASLQRDLLTDIGLDADDQVLDVGCGTGATSRVLVEQTGRVDAIDQSRQQLEQARETDQDVRCVQGDAHNLPYASETFDAVVSVGAILYFSEPIAMLAEAYRVTRPEGRLLVAGFNRPPFPSWNPVENWATLANETFFATSDRAEARQQARAAGWGRVESWVTGPDWHPRLIRVTTAEKTEG